MQNKSNKNITKKNKIEYEEDDYSKKMHESNSDNINDNINRDLMLFVLNEKNKLITKSVIEKCLKKYGIEHKVKNLDMFQTAMVHSSYLIRDLKNDRILKIVKDKNIEPIPEKYIKTALPLQEHSYERLEFLGDSIIHAIVADYLEIRYGNSDEGFLTKLRTKIENGKMLSDFSRAFGLRDYVIISRNLELIGSRDTSDSVLEDVFEAFIGALYRETSFEICHQLIFTMIETEIDLSDLINLENNYKDTLLQLYHKYSWKDPEYGSRGALEKNGKKIFKMYVMGYKKNKSGHEEWCMVGEGEGKSKKEGQQNAAKSALDYYNVLQDDTDNMYDEPDFDYC